MKLSKDQAATVRIIVKASKMIEAGRVANDERKAQFCALAGSGLTYAQVSEATGVPYAVVYQAVNRK